MVEELGTGAELECHGRRIEAEQLPKRDDLNRAGNRILCGSSPSINVADGNRTAPPGLREPCGDCPLCISPRPAIGQEGPQPVRKWLRGLKRLGQIAEFEVRVRVNKPRNQRHVTQVVRPRGRLPMNGDYASARSDFDRAAGDRRARDRKNPAGANCIAGAGLRATRLSVHFPILPRPKRPSSDE
jgi:hypothetical protein